MKQPDYQVEFDVIEADSFFYDPRSYKADFSDARYMGEAKWMDLETAQDMFPEHAEDLASSVEDSSYLSTNPDRETKFFAFDGGKHLIRMVDIWYLHKGEWCQTIFTGSMILYSGKSYLFDDDKKTMCRYIMFAEGRPRTWRSLQGFLSAARKSARDEQSARRSRSRCLPPILARSVLAQEDSVADVERAPPFRMGRGGLAARRHPIRERRTKGFARMTTRSIRFCRPDETDGKCADRIAELRAESIAG